MTGHKKDHRKKMSNLSGLLVDKVAQHLCWWEVACTPGITRGAGKLTLAPRFSKKTKKDHREKLKPKIYLQISKKM